MDTGDIYFSYLNNDKQQCDSEANIVPSETDESLEPIETMFADIGDGNLAWTIDGYSVLMNPEQNKDTIATNIKYTNNPEPQGNSNPNNVLVSNESLLLQLNLQLQNENSVNNNNLIETTKDPIINGSGNGNANQQSILRKLPNKYSLSILKNSRSILKNSTLEDVRTADMIEEVSAFNCRKCGLLCRVRQEIVDHIKAIHLGKEAISETTASNATTVSEDSLNEETVSIVYLCGICSKVGYNSQELLRQHMIGVHEVGESNENFENNCPLIPDKETKAKSVATTGSNNILRNYQLFAQQLQKNMSKIRCSIKYCESRFTSDEFRLLHEKCHCDYPFPNNNEGDGIVSVKSLKDYTYKCTECDTRFVLWKSCSSHLWSRHRINIGLYSCPMCPRFKCVSPHGVLKHLTATHLSTNNLTTTTKPCLCNICGTRYKSPAQLRTHLKRAHQSAAAQTTASYACPTCCRDFASLHSLRKHEKETHSKTKIFVCTVCEYRTARKDTIERHLRGHTGEKPYQCGQCEFSSADHNSLRRHQMRHLGRASYSCLHCPYTSIQSSSYKQHLIHKHPGLGGLYTCPICATRYIRHATFTAHMRDHRTGIVSTPPATQVQEENVPNYSPVPIAQKQQPLPLVSILCCSATSTNPKKSNKDPVHVPDKES